ncbi:hypothetical protein [Parasitella parasitica]|uniref:Uncharacterized protein n=1 Tax=Parasitella parasitica TaxID=35722 RepID=A0A0B7NPZ8_9FUNG|nr:hypothetical protein [Parasitella parasitica]
MSNECKSTHSTNTRQSNINDKLRKLRWSSCFSFVMNKLGRNGSKLSSNRKSSQSCDKLDKKHAVLSETINVLRPKIPSASSPRMIWHHPQPHQQPPAPLSLSPPPRQIKSKRESFGNQSNSDATPISRRILIDPTLTPRVEPISTKTKKQPSLLRLSMDIELLMSSDIDNDSCIALQSGVGSVSPFRSGTLDITNASRSNSASLPPPLPPLTIPLDSCINNSRPHSQLTTTDSPISTTASDDEEHKLTLIERRRRRSPLTMPNSDQLTLAVEDKSMEDVEKPLPPLPTESPQNTSRPQSLMEPSACSMLNDPSRQDAMLALEGKKVRAVSLQPIAHIRELDDHFEQSTDNDIVRDKAQYDAVVSRTKTYSRQLSYEDKAQSRTLLRARSPPVASIDIEPKQQQLEIITENEIAMCRTPTSANNRFPALSNTLLSTTPETPSYHKQAAPSLISAPSTPNSIDSSMIEHDDYISHQKHQMSLFLVTATNTATHSSNQLSTYLKKKITAGPK